MFLFFFVLDMFMGGLFDMCVLLERMLSHSYLFLPSCVSFCLCPRVCLVWPMYVCRQLLHENWHTIFFFRDGILGMNYELSKDVYGVDC